MQIWRRMGGLKGLWQALVRPRPTAAQHRQSQISESWAALVLPDKAPTDFAMDLLAGASLAELEQAALVLPIPPEVVGTEIVGPLAARHAACQIFLLLHCPRFSLNLHLGGKRVGTLTLSRTP